MKRASLALAMVAIMIFFIGIAGPLTPGGQDLMASEETVQEAEAAEMPASGVPLHWAYSKTMWASMALIFAVMGTAWAQGRIGVAGAGAMAEKPELAGTYIVLIAIPETMVILGFVIAAMIILMT